MDIAKVIQCYQKYMEFVVERVPSYKEYIQNMTEKMEDEEFLTDVLPLLRPEIHFVPKEAFHIVHNALFDRLPGKKD